MTISELRELLKVYFPKVWIKDGAEFSRGHRGSLWTGEGSMINVTVAVGGDRMTFEVPAFDMSDMSEMYVFGVHRELHAFLDQRGFFAEAHDPGTYFIYPA
jgi:hypothetical protein